MKCKTIINSEHEEEVFIYAHERNELVEKIEKLVSGETDELIGYTENEAEIISVDDVYCFIVESNRVYALTSKNKYLVKQRLYQLEAMQNSDFIKINQSCIANIKAIQKFNASISGSLMVAFKNGYVDYVSRRNLKNVKERLGL